MQRSLIFTLPNSRHHMHYRVKRKCSKLLGPLHNAVIISIRLRTFASSVGQKVPRDLINFRDRIFYPENSRQQRILTPSTLYSDIFP